MKRTIEERLKNIESEIETIKREITGKKFFGKRIGDTFDLIGVQWKVLDITGDGYVCMAMEPVREGEEFDASGNNWENSKLRSKLHEKILPKIKNEVGNEGVIKFKRDLISLDGLTEYGDCMDEISLISVDEYRKYRKLIPNSGREWWWTITPWSTAGNNDKAWVAVVSPPGNVSFNNYGNCFGVRPFCIFSSKLFESRNE